MRSFQFDKKLRDSIDKVQTKRYGGKYVEREVKKFMGKEHLTEESVYQNTFPGYPDVVDVEDLCEMLGISSVTAYKLLKGGKIEHLRIGRKYKIPKMHILRYLGLVA